MRIRVNVDHTALIQDHVWSEVGMCCLSTLSDVLRSYVAIEDIGQRVVTCTMISTVLCMGCGKEIETTVGTEAHHQ